MVELSPKEVLVSVKRYAAGKAWAYLRGDRTYAEQAARALQRSLVVVAKIDGERFLRLMHEQGVPLDVARGWLDWQSVDDEAWMQDVAPC